MTTDAKYLGLTTNQLAKIASDLKAENKKLRRELDFYKAQVEPVDEDNRRLRERWKEALAENAKLRDAMYADANRHGLQHMDADELRIWATQQAELIDAVRKVAKDMYPSYCYSNGGNGETYLTYEQDADIRDRVRELGVLGE